MQKTVFCRAKGILLEAEKQPFAKPQILIRCGGNVDCTGRRYLILLAHSCKFDAITSEIVSSLLQEPGTYSLQTVTHITQINMPAKQSSVFTGNNHKLQTDASSNKETRKIMKNAV